MAHAHVNVWAEPACVVENVAGEIEVRCGNTKVAMSRDEAADLCRQIAVALESAESQQAAA